MKKRNFVTYISIPLLIGLLSSVLLWRSLTYFNDELSPPLWILIIVWNILFILIGYATWTFRKNHISMILYGCLLFMTLCWLILFYLLHFYVIGAVWMLLTITLSFVLIKRNIKSYKYALIGLLPYLTWIRQVPLKNRRFCAKNLHFVVQKNLIQHLVKNRILHRSGV